MAGLDATETGNEFSQLNFSLQVWLLGWKLLLYLLFLIIVTDIHLKIPQLLRTRESVAGDCSVGIIPFVREYECRSRRMSTFSLFLIRLRTKEKQIVVAPQVSAS